MKVYAVFILLLLLFIPLSASADPEATVDASTNELTPSEEQAPNNVFIVNEYRYEPGTAGGNTDIGQSLCGTRCNALSVDYQNYLKPPGWRMIRIAINREVKLDLNNPFMDGDCVCIADEYVIKINELYMVKQGDKPQKPQNE